MQNSARVLKKGARFYGLEYIQGCNSIGIDSYSSPVLKLPLNLFPNPTIIPKCLLNCTPAAQLQRGRPKPRRPRPEGLHHPWHIHAGANQCLDGRPKGIYRVTSGRGLDF